MNGVGAMPNQHDMLTGSTTAGRAFTDGMGQVQLGHHDRTGGNTTSWNSAHGSRGCSQPNLIATGGNGYFYCFAAN